MTLEEVVKKAISDNADCLGGECDCVALGVAKAVRDFLLSDEVVEKAARGLLSHRGCGEPPKGDFAAVQFGLIALGDSRAALSSITGDE